MIYVKFIKFIFYRKYVNLTQLKFCLLFDLLANNENKFSCTLRQKILLKSF